MLAASGVPRGPLYPLAEHLGEIASRRSDLLGCVSQDVSNLCRVKPQCPSYLLPLGDTRMQLLTENEVMLFFNTSALS